MCAPLYDSVGKLRYFLGAQVDLNYVICNGTDMESFQRLRDDMQRDSGVEAGEEEKKDEFQQLSEMLDIDELNAVRKWGGRMLQEQQEDGDASQKMRWRRPAVLLRDPSRDYIKGSQISAAANAIAAGFYQHVSPGQTVSSSACSA